jgi:hypothetical protein
MKRLILVIVWLHGVFLSEAQQTDDWQKMVSDLLETMAEQGDVGFDYEAVMEDLMDFAQYPLNMNEATKEDLEKFFFLSDFQIENILFYHYQNGPMYTIYELQAVEGMDMKTITALMPFVEVAPVDTKRKVKPYGQTLWRFQGTIQTPEGYQPKNDTIAPAYAGSKYRWLSKNKLYINEQLQLGVTLEKDPGEKFFPNHFPVVDYTSGYLALNKPIKYVDKLIVGDYHLTFGQGLGMWTSLAFSKSLDAAQLRRRAKGLSPNTSVNENQFLRGLACRLKYNKFSLTPFVSYKKRDASLADQEEDVPEINSLQESGYHRTETELINRKAINETIYGARLAYRHHWFQLEGGMASWHIDKAILPKAHLKDLYRFEGKAQNTAWMSHAFFFNRLTLFGEMAFQELEHLGLFQGLTYNAGNDILISAAFRTFSKSYYPFLSNPFAESSTPAGETGTYISFRFKPVSKIQVRLMGDAFQYKWLRYGVYSPSKGYEVYGQVNYQANRQNEFYLRYKQTSKEVNGEADGPAYQIDRYRKQSIRLFYSYKASNKWFFQTQVEQSFYKEGSQKSKGWLAFQDIRYKSGKYFTWSLRYALFDVEDYDSRLYSYEPDVLYAFSVPAYMNQGSRYIANVSMTPVKNLRFWLRFAHTNYNNLDFISSGNQKIEGHHHTEMKVQVQYRF